jgi:hypothetical protein
MGANHIAARIAFDHGLNVATAVVVRSLVTAVVVSLIVYFQHISSQYFQSVFLFRKVKFQCFRILNGAL